MWNHKIRYSLKYTALFNNVMQKMLTWKQHSMKPQNPLQEHWIAIIVSRYYLGSLVQMLIFSILVIVGWAVLFLRLVCFQIPRIPEFLKTKIWNMYPICDFYAFGKFCDTLWQPQQLICSSPASLGSTCSWRLSLLKTLVSRLACFSISKFFFVSTASLFMAEDRFLVTGTYWRSGSYAGQSFFRFLWKIKSLSQPNVLLHPWQTMSCLCAFWMWYLRLVREPTSSSHMSQFMPFLICCTFGISAGGGMLNVLCSDLGWHMRFLSLCFFNFDSVNLSPHRSQGKRTQLLRMCLEKKE